MTILNVTEARARLYKLISETTETHQPIVITGKRGNAVLVAEGDWNSIYETLFLLSISGMRKSIREGICFERHWWVGFFSKRLGELAPAHE